MIIARAPLRISLCGGGTDMPAFYRVHGGAVVSMAIDKYVTVLVNRKFDGKIRLSYSRTENVDRPQDLKHDLVRHTLEDLDVIGGLEIVSVADIPGEGSGLGSSSAFTVALAMALSKHLRGSAWSPKSLAETAYHIENDLAGHITGKQDQYAAAYGGLKFYQFRTDGTVTVDPFCMMDEELTYIADRLMLFWTGKTRSADDILREQNHRLCVDPETERNGQIMLELAIGLNNALRMGDYDAVGTYMARSWEVKKTFAAEVSNAWLDAVIERGIYAGAMGGKVCGAGGSGFVLFYAAPEVQAGVEKGVGLRRVPIRLEERGASITFDGGTP